MKTAEKRAEIGEHKTKVGEYRFNITAEDGDNRFSTAAVSDSRVEILDCETGNMLVAVNWIGGRVTVHFFGRESTARSR